MSMEIVVCPWISLDGHGDNTLARACVRIGARKIAGSDYMFVTYVVHDWKSDGSTTVLPFIASLSRM